jgi:predicted MFS family arabinose efflux permease
MSSTSSCNEAAAIEEGGGSDEVSEPYRLDGGTIGLMAFAAGLFVASIYYNQPMLGILAREFGTNAGGVSAVAVATQVGYAAGLLFCSSLGDLFERRRLITITTVALSLSLGFAALAPGLGALVAASLCIGLFATVAQQVVPMAAHLASAHERGRVVGSVMAGLLSGILLARTVSGVVSEYASWREMFGIASLSTTAMGVLLAVRLPRVEPTSTISYSQNLLSLLRLTREHSLLRRSGLVQALLFGSFVAFWANLALFLEKPPLRAGSSLAGLLGLLGAAGVLAAPLAGRFADKRGGGGKEVIIFGAATVLGSFLIFGLFQSSWIAIIAGILLMDVGVQAAMISNQSRVYALDATAPSRLNTVYMTTMFVGGALGAVAGSQAFARFGWGGVCVMGLFCAASALAVEICSPSPVSSSR